MSLLWRLVRPTTRLHRLCGMANRAIQDIAPQMNRPYGWLAGITQTSHKRANRLHLDKEIIMSKTTENGNADLEAFKQSAVLLQARLEAEGIRLKNGVALEALSACLGMPNWRTLRAKCLGARPSQQGDALRPRWLVVGVYDDNGQRWADAFHAESPLEAQILAQMDRLADGGTTTSISISSVVDRRTGDTADTEASVDDTRLVPMRDALIKLVELAKRGQPHRPLDLNGATVAWDRENACLELWDGIANGKSPRAKKLTGALDELVNVACYRTGLRRGTTALDFVGTDGVRRTLDVARSLASVVRMATTYLELAERARKLTRASPRREGPQQSGVFQVLQVQAFLSYFEDRVGALFEEPDLSLGQLGLSLQ